MAFFKFPWSGKKAPAAPTRSGKGAQAVLGETVEVMRRRARHRLTGAALLVVVAVVGFPVLFDSQPRSIPVDAKIEIPDRDSVPPLVVSENAPDVSDPKEEVLEASRTAPAPESASKPKPVAASGQSAEPPTDALAAKASPKEALTRPKPASTPAFVEAKADSPRVRDEPETAVPAPVAPASSSASAQQNARSEADRARALLEGRSVKSVAAAPAIPVADGNAERFIVQVGAFSDESKAREARAKLERSGLTTYTQPVQTKEGKRTRVRVGPFSGRQEAERAASKIKALGLPAAVLSL